MAKLAFPTDEVLSYMDVLKSCKVWPARCPALVNLYNLGNWLQIISAIHTREFAKHLYNQ